MTATKELRIGVFIPVGARLLDLSPIDLFSMITPRLSPSLHTTRTNFQLGQAVHHLLHFHARK
jgi:hypothetical protein